MYIYIKYRISDNIREYHLIIVVHTFSIPIILLADEQVL